MPKINRKILRTIDANANRLTEGLRVCEDVTRFILEDRSGTRRLKLLRHKASSAVEKLTGGGDILLAHRDAAKDKGRKSASSEKIRKNAADIFKANIKRAEEAARVIEEFAKLAGRPDPEMFKDIRFELYSLEKGLVKKMRALCHSR